MNREDMDPSEVSTENHDDVISNPGLPASQVTVVCRPNPSESAAIRGRHGEPRLSLQLESSLGAFGDFIFESTWRLVLHVNPSHESPSGAGVTEVSPESRD